MLIISTWADVMSKYMSSYLNNKKRTLKGTDVKLMKKIKAVHKNFELVFDKVPLTTKNIILYHGFISNTHFPLVYHFDRYIATSLLMDVAIGFTLDYPCCLLEIKVLPGSKVLPMINISHLDEAEVILYKGTFRQYKPPVFIKKVYYSANEDKEISMTLKKYFVEYLST